MNNARRKELAEITTQLQDLASGDARLVGPESCRHQPSSRLREKSVNKQKADDERLAANIHVWGISVFLIGFVACIVIWAFY